MRVNFDLLYAGNGVCAAVVTLRFAREDHGPVFGSFATVFQRTDITVAHNPDAVDKTEPVAYDKRENFEQKIAVVSVDVLADIV